MDIKKIDAFEASVTCCDCGDTRGLGIYEGLAALFFPNLYLETIAEQCDWEQIDNEWYCENCASEYNEETGDESDIPN